MTILVIAQTVEPHRQAEALRAALGLALRGATVEVVTTGPLLTPLAERAAATLRSFGHVVGHVAGHLISAELEPALARADAVEVWT